MSLTADIVPPSDLTDADIAVWNDLCSSRSPSSVAFLSYPYALVAERTFPDVRVCHVRRDGRSVAFFPFQFRSAAHRWLGIGERLGGELSDYFGVAAAVDFSIDPQLLLQLCGLKALFFTHLEDGQRAFGLEGSMPEPGHLIDFPDGGHAFWQQRRTIDKKFVADTERRERNLVREHGALTFKLQSPTPLADLEHLIAAKREQYSRTNVTDALEGNLSLAFLRALSEMNHPLCSGLLSSLYAGDTWVASHFGLQCNDTLHYWFPVYNHQLSSYGPGRLLLKRILDSGHEHGISRVDRGAGDTVAKRDFSTSRHQFSRGLWYRRGIRAAGYRACLSVRWRIEMLKARNRTR